MADPNKVLIVFSGLICCYVFFAILFYRDFWKSLKDTNVSKISSTLLQWDRYSNHEISALTQGWLHEQMSRVVQSKSIIDAVNTTSFDPFSVYSGVNIWDLFPPELSCPDVRRIGNIGDGNLIYSHASLDSNHSAMYHRWEVGLRD
jgi:hypothetical protein